MICACTMFTRCELHQVRVTTADNAALALPYEPPTLRELPPAEMPTSAILRRLASLLAVVIGPESLPLYQEARARAALLERAGGITRSLPAQQLGEAYRVACADIMRAIGEVR